MRTGRLSYTKYIADRIEAEEAMGKAARAERHRQLLKRLLDFTGGRDVYFASVDMNFVEAFDAYLSGRGNCKNTISFYNRIARAMYNRAVDEALTDDRKPFKRAYTGVDRTMKRAIPLQKVAQICRLDLSGDAAAAFARDMFMLSFYLRGMSWVDMCLLREADIIGGVLVYRRKKTSQLMRIRVEKPAADIIRHRHGTGGMLLGIVDAEAEPARKRAQIRNAGQRVTQGLKKVARRVGLDNLTMYVARHSWATGCRSSGVPISIISEGLGHDSEETTRIYLAELDTTEVDKANRKIMKAVCESSCTTSRKSKP